MGQLTPRAGGDEAGGAEESDYAYCQRMLPLVSRTFAACIGLLPPRMKRPVLLAYLLCRVADTIEDRADLPAARKRTLLAVFRASLAGGATDAIVEAFAEPRSAEEDLTHRCPRVLRCYADLPERQRAAIRPWVAEMCEGMGAFAVRYDRERSAGRLQSLESMADLDRYCYYVAGTVGHLLTDLFRTHHHRFDTVRYRRLKRLSTSFGLGLQLTNIIKDVADDRRRDWSYVPRDLCQQMGLRVEQLLDLGTAAHARAVMNTLIDHAAGHLDKALAYCTALPRSEYRIRLFCLTPLYFAVRTLNLARRDPRLLDPAHKVKITRFEVRRTIFVSLLLAPINRLVRRYYRHLVHKQPFWGLVSG